MIKWTGLSKFFLGPDARAMCVVDDVDLQIERNEFVSLVGPSGCGKSTLLNLAAGLDTPTKGARCFSTGRRSPASTAPSAT